MDKTSKRVPTRRLWDYALPLAFFVTVAASLAGDRMLWWQTANQSWLERGIAVLEKAHRLDRHHPVVQSLLSDVYQAEGQTQKAIRLLETTARDYPQLAWPYVLLGKLQEEQGDLQGAMAMYQRAVEADKGSETGHLEQGRTLEESGNVDQAIEQYRLAAQATPASHRPHLALASLYDREGMSDRALASYRQALLLEPDAAIAYLGQVHPDRRELISIVRQLASLPLDTARAYVVLGDIFYAEGLSQEAQSLYLTALEMYPDPQVLLKSGDLYRAQKNGQDAIAQYAQARQAAPWSNIPLSRLLQTRGDIYLGSGLLSQALTDYLSARSLDPATDRNAHREQYDRLTAHVAYDFFEHLDQSPGNNSEPFVSKTVFIINGKPQRVMYQHPTLRMAYTVHIPSGSRLAFSIALDPASWSSGIGDGVQFDLHIADPDTEWQPYSQYIDPKNVDSDRRWHSHAIDLAPWSGRTVTITFATTPGPEGDDRYDWAGWGDPRIVQPAHYRFLEHPGQAGYGTDQLQSRKAWMVIDGDPRYVLLQTVPSRIVYPDVQVINRSALCFGIGIDPRAWSAGLGDGVEFAVYVQDTSSHQVQVFDRYIDPKHNPYDRRWFDTQIDLRRFAGQTVDIHFVTRPGPADNDEYDWAGWSTPMLVTADVPPVTPQELAQP